MKNKFIVGFLLLLNLSILVVYNNCGQLSHKDKTSTQAPNPGDFGGGDDSGNFNEIADHITRLVDNVCEKTAEANDEYNYEACYTEGIDGKRIVQTFYNDEALNNLEALFIRIQGRELEFRTLPFVECENHVLNFINNPLQLEQFKKQLALAYGDAYLSNLTEMDYATLILRASPACLTFIAERTAE